MPAYVKEYQKRYGSIEGVCVQMPFTDIGKVATNKIGALTADVPSFIRLNQTFGYKASTLWVYTHLKMLLVNFLVDENKISDQQIEFLAETIISNHPSMTLTEFMLFESYFLAGRYKEFYGETSYFLAITSSLQQFKKDLAVEYAVIEREQQGKSKERYSDVVYRCWHNLVAELLEVVSEDQKKILTGMYIEKVSEYDKGFRVVVTQEQYDLLYGACHPVFIELGKKHFAKVKVQKIQYVRATPQDIVKRESASSAPSKSSKNDILVGCRSAHAVLDNIYKFDEENSAKLRDVFRKRYGLFPEEYLKCYETKDE